MVAAGRGALGRADAARFLCHQTGAWNAYFSLDRKYSPNQPRVPAGNSDGGQWTSGAGGSTQNDTAQSSGNIDLGNVPSFSDLFALFQITPQEFDTTDDIQLAGDPPGIGHNGGPSLEPPDIPDERPLLRADRVGFLKDAAAWLSHVGKASIVGQIFSALQTMSNGSMITNTSYRRITIRRRPLKSCRRMLPTQKRAIKFTTLWSRPPPRGGV